ALPSWRTNSPRFGAGTACHFLKASWARWIVCSYSSGVAVRTRAITSPSIGETLSSNFPLPPHSPQKTPAFVSSIPSLFRILRRSFPDPFVWLSLSPRFSEALAPDGPLRNRFNGFFAAIFFGELARELFMSYPSSKATTFLLHNPQRLLQYTLVHIQHGAQPNRALPATNHQQPQFIRALPE